MPKVSFLNELITVDVPAGQTLLEIAEKNGIEVFRGIWPELHCGRMKGWCNRCKLWATPLAPGALSERTSKEKSRLRVNGAIPLHGTMRLACQAVVSGDCEVRTRSDAPERKPEPTRVWEADPRPSKWKERLEIARAGGGGGEEEEEEAAEEA